MYLLKLALRPWRTAPLSQAFSGLAVGLLLLLAGFLYWVQGSLKPVLYRLQSEQVITAYLDTSVDAKDEAKLVDSIRVAIGSQAADIRLVGPQKFVDDVKGHYPELGKELESLGGEVNSIVPRYVSIAGVLPGPTIDKIKAVEGIESAETSKDRYVHIVGAFKALRWVAKLFIAGICFALFTGLIQLSRMNSHLHLDALHLLRLWGASTNTLRIPGLLSGLWVGMAGGIVAAIGWLTGGVWLARQMRHLSVMLKDIPLPSSGMAFVLLLTGAALGLLAGALGGVPATARGAELKR